MISAKYRFKGNRLIDFVYRKGQPARSGYLGAKATKPNDNSYKIAVVVSKKISKSAVVRNRIRRRVFEQVRIIAKDRKEDLNLNIVITVYDEKVAKQPAEELRADLQKLIEKLEPRLK